MIFPKFTCRVHKVNYPPIKNSDVQLSILRCDEIPNGISGNKYFKLKYNLAEAQLEGHKTLLTFGGAFSNHIEAVAIAGKQFNFKTIGIIRGDELGKNITKTLASNPTLQFAVSCGMEFKFISRDTYRDKENPLFLKDLEEEFGDFYLLPEGGTNTLAVKGCEEILSNKTHHYDFICVSVGSGGTIAGIINSAENHQTVLGFSSIKKEYLLKNMHSLINDSNKKWLINDSYSCNGFGKISKDLINFVNDFNYHTQVPLDPIYTGKMFLGIVDLIKENYFPLGSKILSIHTGGLQGIKSMNNYLKSKNLPKINC